MDYELKLRRHASREIDKYWENFQKSTSYQHLLTVPGFSQVPPDEIRLILVTFFVHAFDNLRSTIQALDTEHVAAGLQETLQTYHDDALDRSESLAIAAELLKTFMIWLIATNEIKLTILEFVDALMNVFVTATYLLGLTEEEALTSPFGNDDFDLPGVDDAFSDPDNDVDFDSENMAELFQLTMTFLESKTWLQVPKPVQNQELFGATTLFLAHTIQSLFGHDPKNWTAQDIKAAMSMLLYDKKPLVLISAQSLDKWSLFSFDLQQPPTSGHQPSDRHLLQLPKVAFKNLLPPNQHPNNLLVTQQKRQRIIELFRSLGGKSTNTTNNDTKSPLRLVR